MRRILFKKIFPLGLVLEFEIIMLRVIKGLRCSTTPSILAIICAKNVGAKVGCGFFMK
jgi:hypothetical protein